MAQTTQSATKHVYLLLDESGSMQQYTEEIRRSVRGMIECNFDADVEYTAITFSERTESGKDLSRFKAPQHSYTCIIPAFRELNRLVRNRRAAECVAVVLVSDGDDSHEKRDILSEKLRLMGGFPTHSVMITIGVGKDFPTGLVVDTLRPIYHKGSSSTQSILPVYTPEDLPWAFGQLGALLHEELSGAATAPRTVDESSSNRDLIKYIQATYHECVIQCAAQGRTPKENYTLLFEAKLEITNVLEISRARMATERDDARPFKPLVSNILSLTVYTAKAAHTSALSAVTRLNSQLKATAEGQLISELSDEAKKELMGGVFYRGKLTAVASKYKGANINTTKSSLLRLLRDYTSNSEHEQIEDTVHMGSQDEYFLDAKAHMLDVVMRSQTLLGIVDTVPVIGRTVTLAKPLPLNALQMNEWLAEVTALPQIIAGMNTYDLIKRHDFSYSSRGVQVDSLMLIPQNEKSQGIFIHLQTYLLLRNPELFVITSRLAMAASVLFFILGSHDRLSEWLHRELRLVDDVCRIYTRQFLENWHLYVDAATRPDFRQCLVAESPQLPPHTKCPGLTKFVLALYAAARGLTAAEPHLFPLADLRDRHRATVVEFLARARVPVSSCLRYDAQAEADAFLARAWSTRIDPDGGGEPMTVGNAILATSLTLKEAKLRFGTLVELGLRESSLTASSTASARISTSGLEAATHYQLSLARIGSAFRNLACLCGHGQDIDFTLAPLELMDALKTASAIPSAYERSRSPPNHSTADTLAQTLAEKQFGHCVRCAMESVAEDHYTARHADQHSGLARIIPRQHMDAFKLRQGLDIATDWAVNASGLSNNACCCPECPHYLELLNTRTATRSPTICTELHQHLLMSTAEQPIPGFHKTVSRFRDCSPDSVMDSVETGRCIDDPLPTAVQRRYIKDLQVLATINGAEATHYFELELTKSISEKRTKLVACAKDKCHELDSGALLTDIAALQTEFGAPTWPYEDFEQTFLAKYRKYPRLSGTED